MSAISNMRHDLTQAYVREILRYVETSGEFFWSGWLRRTAVGARAGSARYDGYRVITIKRVPYAEHRLAWLYMTGAWSETIIDHVNGIPDDNRWENLREATLAQSSQNRRGIGFLQKGVTLHRCGRYQAYIGKKYIGLFDTEEEAHQAYASNAEAEYGAFARTS